MKIYIYCRDCAPETCDREPDESSLYKCVFSSPKYDEALYLSEDEFNWKAIVNGECFSYSSEQVDHGETCKCN